MNKFLQYVVLSVMFFNLQAQEKVTDLVGIEEFSNLTLSSIFSSLKFPSVTMTKDGNTIVFSDGQIFNFSYGTNNEYLYCSKKTAVDPSPSCRIYDIE